MTDVEKNVGMTQAQIASQIEANKKKIDENLAKLGEIRIRLEKECEEEAERLARVEGLMNFNDSSEVLKQKREAILSRVAEREKARKSI